MLFRSISVFIPYARKLGYKGIVMTSWSTSGIYSPIFESATEVVDLPAVRRVYPQTGFNMLIEAYFQSLKDQKPLDTKAFVNTYCKNTYGFSSEQADQFWKALTTAPLEVNYNAVRNSKMSIKNLLDTSVFATKVLHSLKPQTNKKEFDHYLLMADIRNFYLTCMWIESELNDTSYNFSKAPILLQELNKLDPAALNKRFITLNKDAYYLSELETENYTRNIRYQILKDKLTNQR